MILEEVFFEKSELKAEFLKWFGDHNIHDYDPNKMPEFMALPIIVKWLEKKALYIDRDTECREMKIWGYLEGEPEEAIIIDVIDFTEGPEEWFKVAIEKCLEIITERK